jgi:hypothetical protein
VHGWRAFAWGGASQHAFGSQVGRSLMDARPIPRPAQAHNLDHSNALSLFAVATVVVALCPGALLGALLAAAIWRATSPDILTRWLVGGLGAATVGVLHTAVAIGWPWRLLLQGFDPSFADGLAPDTIGWSVLFEALLGPLVLAAQQSGQVYWRRTIQGQEWARYREVTDRKKALERGWPGPEGSQAAATPGHPEGTIRLGVGADDGRAFDLGADEIAQHIFVPGASGTGKTTTLVRIADGALANGYGVVIVDCKGSGLGAPARELATRHGVPFTLVDPRDKRSVGYDPCSGDAASVANKIVGAFTFSGEAEIYKQVAMEVIPVICRAMLATGTPVTLDGIYTALARGEMSRLGRRNGAEAYRERLEQLEDAGGVSAAGYVGLQKRLGALMEGAFGDLFSKRPALDWHKQTVRPHVTYLSLSATAAGEDVELFGRVITQDLKQLCDERMRAIERGKAIAPVLIIYDEFAALREQTQIVDLLLQARQALAPIVVATQFIPEEVPIRRPVLGAGVLIVHRLEAEDAEKIAAQFGTHTTTALTAQLDYETGTSEKGSVRWVEEFNVHPNELKELPVGVAAVYARRSKRRSLVRVHRSN